MLRAGFAAQRRGAGSAGPTVLLVEEDAVVRNSLVRALASEGFLIQGTDPGAMMEAALEGNAYHAVLVSVEGGMVAADAEALAANASTTYRRRSPIPEWSRIRRVRRLHPSGRLVVLTVTASRLSSDAVELEGVDALVEKPLTVGALVALLREMLVVPGTDQACGVGAD